jgi:hypothetical protein
MRNYKLFWLQFELATDDFNYRSWIVISADEEVLALDVRNASIVNVHEIVVVVEVRLDEGIVREFQMKGFVFRCPVVVDHEEILLRGLAYWMRTACTTIRAARRAGTAFQAVQPVAVASIYTRIIPTAIVVTNVAIVRAFCTADFVFI